MARRNWVTGHTPSMRRSLCQGAAASEGVRQLRTMVFRRPSINPSLTLLAAVPGDNSDHAQFFPNLCELLDGEIQVFH